MIKRLLLAALLVLVLPGCAQPSQRTPYPEYRPVQPEYRPDPAGFDAGRFDDGLGLSGADVTPADIRNWRARANAGDPEAQARLGVAYAFGWGVREDAAEAVRWYRRAADQGVPAAQYNLGTMYESGSGVPQDYVLAHLWYNLAAASFPPGTARNTALRKRDALTELLTPDQLAEAQRMARTWRPR